MFVFAMPSSSYLLPERDVESLEQRSALTVVGRRRGYRDIHAPDLVDLVVLDFRENNLFLHAHAVVALAVEGARRHTAKVTNARHRDADETVEELVHPSAPQGHLATDRKTLTDLERRNRLTRLGDERLLAGDLLQIRHRRVHHFLVGNRLTDTHVHRDFGDLGNLHRVVDLEIGLQLRNDRLVVKLL